MLVIIRPFVLNISVSRGLLCLVVDKAKVSVLLLLEGGGKQNQLVVFIEAVARFCPPFRLLDLNGLSVNQPATQIIIGMVVKLSANAIFPQPAYTQLAVPAISLLVSV